MGFLRPIDLSLYLVTDTVMCDRLGVAATVSSAVGSGVSVVQLRDADATDDELVRLGREVMAALRGAEVPLIINDRVHLVQAIGAQGAHVGQGDLDADLAREMLGPDAYLGLSVQTVDHLAAARELADGTVDYLGVGPVWATSSKVDAAAPSGLERLGHIVSSSPWPCVAIGGVTAENLPHVRRAGAAGVAVVSAICGQPDVAAATHELRVAWDGATTRQGAST